MKIKIVKAFLFSLALCANFLYAENENIQKNTEEEIEIIEPNVDCLILEDENSIVCKFELTQLKKDENISVQWIAPNGEISRSREMTINEGHSSMYDYRYIDGRENGIWTFKVIFEGKEYATKFELK